MCNKGSVILIGQKKCNILLSVEKVLTAAGFYVELYSGDFGNPFPGAARWWHGDYIFCINSPWIIPKSLLVRARKFGVSWQSCLPNKPGVKAINQTLYHGYLTFGFTCSKMSLIPYQGDILDYHEFDVFDNDNYYTLELRADNFILNSIIQLIEFNFKPKDSIKHQSVKWSKNIFTYKDFQELMVLNDKMTKKEMERRIFATIGKGEQINAVLVMNEISFKPIS